MKFPDFNDFLSENKEKSEKSLSKIAQSIKEPTNIKEVMRAACEINTLYTIELLRQYHNWLASHFEDRQEDNP